MRLSVIVERLKAVGNAELVSGDDCEIYGLGSLQYARSGELCYLDAPKYKAHLRTTAASAVLIRRSFINEAQHASPATLSLVVVDDARLAQAVVSQWFEHDDLTKGLHGSVSLGEDVQIGEGARIGANVVIGAGSQIGRNCRIYPNVTIYSGVRIGDNVRIHSGAVLGSEGFNLVPSDQGWHRFAHVGGLRIGNNCSIGANTTIDRGTLDDTVIGDDVHLDNLVHIAHNVEIGDSTVIAACVGVAGSTKIGRYCRLGGAVGIVGHLRIDDHVTVTAMSFVSRDLQGPGSYSSGTVIEPTPAWRRNAVRFKQLDALARFLRRGS